MTQDEKFIAGSHAAQFIAAIRLPVHLPLGGKTMGFDGHGKCVCGF